MLKAHQNKRQIVPDLLKGIAILFMIQVHIMELFARPVILTSWLGELSLFLGGVPAAPIFMMIMGYMVAKSASTPKTIALRGLKLILWGFMLNLGLNFYILIKIQFDEWVFDKWIFIFGVDILLLAGLSLIVLALLPQLIKKRWYLLLSLVLLIFGLSSAFSGLDIAKPWSYLSSYFIGGTDWSYFPLLPWLAYPISGYAFFSIEKLLPPLPTYKYTSVILAIILLVFTILSWGYAADITQNLPNYYHQNFVFYLWAIFFSLLWSALFLSFAKNIASNKLGQYLIFIGKNITSIYVFQWLIIGNLATIWYKQQDITVIILSFIIITITSSLLSWGWNHLKTKV